MTRRPEQPPPAVSPAGSGAGSGAGDETHQVRLAASPDTAPEVLRALAADPRVTVRAAVALNAAAPPGAREVLAEDADERVRALLARTLAALLPDADDGQRAALRGQAMQTLSALVQDEALRVRAAIADIVKEMPGAPREMILRLARDAAVQVSDPVIRLSPLLTPKDLLGLLADPPNGTILAAVARRANIDEAVSDAVAATADNAAIAALLRNGSAAIREATLDALVARAAPIEAWHDPLVRRPKLSGRAARALSDMVATDLLEVLASRADLDPGVAAELHQRLSDRLSAPPPESPSDTPGGDVLHAQARALAAKGQLTEATLLAAARRGDAQACAAMLAVAADVVPAVVERASALRSGKAIVSLAWAAGFSMKAAVPLQALLGNLPPNAALPGTRAGDFPLATDEMRWQIDLLKGMVGRKG